MKKMYPKVYCKMKFYNEDDILAEQQTIYGVVAESS